MPLELRSFLTAVSVILALVLFVPCIESVLNLVRRRTQGALDEGVANPQMMPNPKPAAGLSREVA